MIRLEIINLLPKDQSPYVLTHEFNDIQGVGQSWAVSTESSDTNLLATGAIRHALLRVSRLIQRPLTSLLALVQPCTPAFQGGKRLLRVLPHPLASW